MVGKKFNDWVLAIFVEVQGGHWVICLGYIFFFPWVPISNHMFNFLKRKQVGQS